MCLSVGVYSGNRGDSCRLAGVTARLQGTVTNTSGSVVPGVNLTAANVSTGMVTPVTSDAPGYYIFPSLVAGTPHSSRQSPDFHTFIMNGLISG